MDAELPKVAVAEILAEKIAALDPARIPAAVRRKCDDLLVDVVGLCVSARNEDYVRAALAAWDLISGRLVRPFDVTLPLSKSYWIVCPKATAMLPKITRARDWLLKEAADDLRRLKAIP